MQDLVDEVSGEIGHAPAAAGGTATAFALLATLGAASTLLG
jgi:hypothetical protein